MNRMIMRIRITTSDPEIPNRGISKIEVKKAENIPPAKSIP